MNQIQTEIQVVEVIVEKNIPVEKIIEVPREVEVIVEKIVEKIVEIPKVIEVEKIVEKIVVQKDIQVAQRVDNHIEIEHRIVDRII